MNGYRKAWIDVWRQARLYAKYGWMQPCPFDGMTAKAWDGLKCMVRGRTEPGFGFFDMIAMRAQIAARSGMSVRAWRLARV